MENKLIDWLKSQEISIRGIARKAGISPSHVSLVFNGQRAMTWNFAAAIADGFGLDHIEAFRLAGLLPTEEKK